MLMNQAGRLLIMKIENPHKKLPRLFIQCCFVILAIGAHPPVKADIDWPQEVITDEGKIIVYQPQPEKLEGNQLFGRSAMSLELKKQADPVFGVFWFRARVDTDHDSGTATIHSLEVTRVRWPDSKDADCQNDKATL